MTAPSQEDDIEAYLWCSLADYFKPKRKRRLWVAVERGLTHLELPDTAAGRRRFLERTEGLIDWKKRWKAGDAALKGQMLNSTLPLAGTSGASPGPQCLAGAAPQDESNRSREPDDPRSAGVRRPRPKSESRSQGLGRSCSFLLTVPFFSTVVDEGSPRG